MGEGDEDADVCDADEDVDVLGSNMTE